jgi:hypothetical protein
LKEIENNMPCIYSVGEPGFEFIIGNFGHAQGATQFI